MPNKTIEKKVQVEKTDKDKLDFDLKELGFNKLPHIASSEDFILPLAYLREYLLCEREKQNKANLKPYANEFIERVKKFSDIVNQNQPNVRSFVTAIGENYKNSREYYLFVHVGNSSNKEGRIRLTESINESPNSWNLVYDFKVIES